MEGSTCVALLRTYSYSLCILSVFLVLNSRITLVKSIVLSLVVTHIRYFLMLLHLLVLLSLRLLICLMFWRWVLMWITATRRSLLTLLTVVSWVNIGTTWCIIVHSYTRTSCTHGEVIGFWRGTWSIAWVANGITWSGLVLARFFLLKFNNHDILLVHIHLCVGAVVILLCRLHGLRTLRRWSTLHNQVSCIVLIKQILCHTLNCLLVLADLFVNVFNLIRLYVILRHLVFLNFLNLYPTSFVSLSLRCLRNKMLLRVLTISMTSQNLCVHGRARFTRLVLHDLELLSLMRFFIFLHQTSQKVFVITCRFRNINAGWWRIEFLSIVRPSITGSSSVLWKVTAKAGTACGSNLDGVSCLMRFSRVRRDSRCMLNGCLMCCLRFLCSLHNVEIVLVLSSGISIFCRVKYLLFSLKLLLKHNLSLWLTGGWASILKSLRITSDTSVVFEVVGSSGGTSIILWRFVSDDLLFEFENISWFRCWWHGHDSMLGIASLCLMRCQRCFTWAIRLLVLLTIIICKLMYQISDTSILHLYLLHFLVLIIISTTLDTIRLV